jgi:hypothetical protein
MTFLKAVFGWLMIMLFCVIMSAMTFYLMAACAWFITFSTAYFYLSNWAEPFRAVLLIISFVLWGFFIYYLNTQDD